MSLQINTKHAITCTCMCSHTVCHVPVPGCTDVTAVAWWSQTMRLAQSREGDSLAYPVIIQGLS